MLKSLSLILALVIALSTSTVFAADTVVVIPLNSSKKIKNVVTVSATSGDFTDPVTAINSITNASAANPYLLLIGPGVYTLTQTLVMKPYVTIAGSGEGATTLTGAINATVVGGSAIVSGANNATLCDLTVTNTGGGDMSTALNNSSSSPVIENVTLNVSGASHGYGMYNDNSSPTITDVTINVAGSSNSYGMVIENNSSPQISNVTANATGSQGSGMFISVSSPIIRYSRISGSFKAIYATSSTIRVMHSSILGVVTKNSGTLSCVNSDNGVDTALDATCQ